MNQRQAKKVGERQCPALARAADRNPDQGEKQSSPDEQENTHHQSVTRVRSIAARGLKPGFSVGFFSRQNNKARAIFGSTSSVSQACCNSSLLACSRDRRTILR